MLIIVMSECDIMWDSLTVRKHDITVTRLCLSPDVMAALSACYSSLFDGLNAEVQIRWLQLVVRNSFYPELPRVRAFLHKHVSNKHHRYCSARGGRGGRCGREMRVRDAGAARGAGAAQQAFCNMPSFLSSDLQDVHRAAVRRPGFRGDEMRCCGDF